MAEKTGAGNETLLHPPFIQQLTLTNHPVRLRTLRGCVPQVFLYLYSYLYSYAYLYFLDCGRLLLLLFLCQNGGG